MTSTDDFIQDYDRVLRAAAVRLAAGEKPRRHWGRRLVVAGALAATIVVAVVIAGSNIASDERPAEDPSRPDAAAFGVLDNEPVSIPSALRRALSEDAAIRRAGIRWGDARRATVRHGVTVYVLPGDGRLCLLVTADDLGTGLSCEDMTAAGGGMLMTRIARGAGTIVAGVVPDGVSSVSLVGEGREASVDGNAFVLPLGDGAGTLEWRGAAGRHSVELPATPTAAGS
jgi:hypothetical protein